MKITKSIIFLLILTCLSLPQLALAISLWEGERAITSSLFIDRKARKVNDIVTVIISESSSATRTATTSTGRESSVDGKVENWFTIGGIRNLFKGLFESGTDIKTKQADANNLPIWKISATHDFKGTGTTSRSDTITARITCKVVDVLPNNNLVIEGKQEVVVNAENQILFLRGIIRPEDITADNIVYSYNIADLTLSYLGKGPLGAKQKRGLFEWLGDLLWPF